MTQAEQIQGLIDAAQSLTAALEVERERTRQARRRTRWLTSTLAVVLALGGLAGWESSRGARAQTGPSGVAAALTGEVHTWHDTKNLIVAMSHLAVAADQALQDPKTKAELATFAGNVMLLTNRITQDSTVWRKEMARAANVANIESEVASPGLEAYRAYQKIPSELSFLNRSMWIMTNTAGKMGSWMP